MAHYRQRQEKPAAPPSGTPETPPPPSPKVVAATVNGQPIPELAVYRTLLQVDPKFWENARKDNLNYLIDNLLVDQYLTQLKIAVDDKDVQARIEQIKAEAKKEGMEFPKLLEKLVLSEDDLRRELTGGCAGTSSSSSRGPIRPSRKCSRRTKTCSTAV